MLGDWVGAPEERRLHIRTANQELGTALADLRSCATAVDVVKYLPPVLEHASRLVNWPMLGDLGLVHDVYYEWTDVNPSAGHLTGFLAARDDVYRVGERLFVAANGWAMPGGEQLIGPQSAGLLGELAAAARRSLDMLAHYAPNAAETAVSPEDWPAAAPGRIGHIVAAFGGLRAALSELENSHEPVEISYRVPAFLTAANSVGQGPASAPSEALQVVIARWEDRTAHSATSPALADARHALVRVGWALAQAIESEATMWRPGDPADATPETDHALDLLAVEADTTWTRVSAS